MVAIESTPTCIIALPTTERSYYKHLRNFDPQKTARQLGINMEMLGAVNLADLVYQDRMEFSRIYSLLKRTYIRYGDKLSEIHDSYGLGEDLRPYLEENQISFSPKIFSPFYGDIEKEKIPALFFRELESAIGPTIALSESHTTTAQLLEVVKRQNGTSRIGMIVFDTHVDTIPSEQREKCNVIDYLLAYKKGEGRLVEQVSVIGEPDELYASQLGQKSDPYSPRYHSRVNVVKEEYLYDPESNSLTFSDHQLQKIIENQIANYAKKSISNVMISFDLDVLNSGFVDYTAMEYSPLHALLFLSTLHLEESKGDPYRTYLQLTNDLEFPYSSTILCEPTLVGGRGLSLEYIHKAMNYIQESCSKYHIQYGVPINNALVLGDIVEFEGPDYHNLTKKAVVSVAKSMYPRII